MEGQRQKAVLRRILRKGLCSVGKKRSDWLIMSDIGVRMEERATFLTGSSRTCSNPFSGKCSSKEPGTAKPDFPFMSEPQITGHLNR